MVDGGIVTISFVVVVVPLPPPRGSITVTAKLSDTVFSSSSSGSQQTGCVASMTGPVSENSEAGVEEAEEATTIKDELSLGGSATPPSTSIDSLCSTVDVDRSGELLTLDGEQGDVTRSTESELQSVVVVVVFGAAPADGGVVTVAAGADSVSKKDPETEEKCIGVNDISLTFGK